MHQQYSLKDINNIDTQLAALVKSEGAVYMYGFHITGKNKGRANVYGTPQYNQILFFHFVQGPDFVVNIYDTSDIKIIEFKNHTADKLTINTFNMQN